MKTIYPETGGIGVHMPYEFNSIKTKADFDLSRQVWEINENGNNTLVGLDNCYIEWESADINYIAGLKIKSVYPEYKQLNILRIGSQEEINAMNAFIDAVRAWANSENPDPWDKTLDQITV
tara:strand:- start:41 stop:403 length:363 start_codon:yes stop_codon:yes gene_type:complete